MCTGTCTYSAIEKPVRVSWKISMRIGDAGGVGHSNMHCMPIHSKLCVNMRITRNRTPHSRCIYWALKLTCGSVQNFEFHEYTHVMSMDVLEFIPRVSICCPNATIKLETFVVANGCHNVRVHASYNKNAISKITQELHIIHVGIPRAIQLIIITLNGPFLSFFAISIQSTVEERKCCIQ